jgi:thymidylate synthase ThyX
MTSKNIIKKVLRDQTATGAVLSLQDILSPEENATVQSLNSRSAGGFALNLEKMFKDGASNFMKKFYSGYGHKSIADCGSTTICLDGISMLAAKAIQDHQLYNGQETSTRYIKMAGDYVDPIDDPRGKKLFDGWFSFYRESLPKVIDHLTKKHPVPDGKDAAKWATTLEKRAYDIMGAFLPAGTKTNVSCHMTLRQWDDKITTLRHHPLLEVQDLANKMHEMLQKKYPSTFLEKKYKDTEEFNALFMKDFYFAKDETGNIQSSFQGFSAHKNFFHESIFNTYTKVLKTRKEKTEFPKVLNQTGSFHFDFLIDYRSFRDLQRQRSATQRMPLLTMEYGFEEWYLESLPDDVRTEAVALLTQQKIELESYNFPIEYMQYYIPMGYKVFTRFTVGLADLIYIIELRTPTTVHPTAREIAKKMFIFLQQYLPKDIPVYANMSEDELNIKRADQDIFVGGESLSKQ